LPVPLYVHAFYSHISVVQSCQLTCMYTPFTAIFLLFSHISVVQSCQLTCMYTPFTAIFLLFSHVSLPACSTCLACRTVHTVMYYHGSLRLLLHVHLPPSPSRTPRLGYMTTPTTNVHYLGANYWHYSTGWGIIHCEGYFSLRPDDLHGPNICLHVH
jgi:hypothetical protein